MCQEEAAGCVRVYVSTHQTNWARKFFPRRMEIKLSRRCQTQSRRQTLRLRGADNSDTETQTMGQVMDGNCFIESAAALYYSPEHIHTNTRPRAHTASDISKYVFGNFTTFKAEFLQPALFGCRRYYRAARVALRPPFHIALPHFRKIY